MRWKSRDADRGAQISEPWYLNLGDLRSQALGHDQRAFRVSLWQNQREFVATEASSGIDSAQYLVETLSQVLQRRIARVVARRVVQLLESIEVEHD